MNLTNALLVLILAAILGDGLGDYLAPVGLYMAVHCAIRAIWRGALVYGDNRRF